MLLGLIGVQPTEAAADEITMDLRDRRYVVEQLRSGGPGVREAAERALLGSEQDVLDFIDNDDEIRFADDSVAVSRMVSVGGPGLRAAAKEALRGTPQQLDSFVVSGWQGPLDSDRQVEVSRIVGLGGTGVREAGEAA
ncbi:hypothetical protein C6N75_28950, partial [Streptomyces solincola]